MTERCIVFDVDDTLYIEGDYIRSGFAAVDTWLLTEHALPGFAQRAWGYFERTFKGDFEESLTRAIESMGLQATPELLETIMHIYCTHEPDIELLPDARQCLNSLHGDFPLAALTEGDIPSQHAKVEVLDINNWCTPVVYASRWGPEEQTRALKEVERRTGFAGQCLFVSHDPHALDIPRQLGWEVARIRRSESRMFHVKTHPDVPEFPDLADFALWLVGARASPSA